MWGELIRAVYDTYQQSKNKDNEEADTENKIEDIKTSSNTDNIINGATSILAPDLNNPAKSVMGGIGSLAKGIAGAINKD